VIVVGLAILLAAFELRAEISFTPAAPSVDVGEKLSLSVSGTVGDFRWSAQKGWIEGTGTSVTYTAPEQPGWDVVTVLDSTGNIGTLRIEIKAQIQDFSEENAIWEVWRNRDEVQALAYSKDKQTLWMALGKFLISITPACQRMMSGLFFRMNKAESGWELLVVSPTSQRMALGRFLRPTTPACQTIM